MQKQFRKLDAAEIAELKKYETKQYAPGSNRLRI